MLNIHYTTGSVLNWAQTAGGGLTIVTPDQAAFGLQNQQQQVVLAGSDQISMPQDTNTSKYITRQQLVVVAGSQLSLQCNKALMRVCHIVYSPVP